MIAYIYIYIFSNLSQFRIFVVGFSSWGAQGFPESHTVTAARYDLLANLFCTFCKRNWNLFSTSVINIFFTASKRHFRTHVEITYFSPFFAVYLVPYQFICLSVNLFRSMRVFSPPARWGLLDFIRAVLLLLRLRILLLLVLLLLAVQIPVGTAGPPPRAPDPSGHCRTSTASSRSQWALPGPHRELQIPVGRHCRTSTATSRSQRALPDLNRDFQIAVGTAGPQRPDRMPEDMSHRMPKDMSDRMPEDMPDRMPDRIAR